MRYGSHTGTVRLFIAVWPAPEVIDGLAQLPRPELPTVRWTVPDQWHVTLRFLGEQPEESVELLGRAIEAAVSGLSSPVEAVVGPSTIRLGPEVLCLPVAGLDELAGAVARELTVAGVVPVVRQPERTGEPYRGHLTLARARRRSRIPTSLVGVPFEARWAVDQVCLVSSRTAPTGARYETVLSVTIH